MASLDSPSDEARLDTKLMVAVGEAYDCLAAAIGEGNIFANMETAEGGIVLTITCKPPP